MEKINGLRVETLEEWETDGDSEACCALGRLARERGCRFEAFGEDFAVTLKLPERVTILASDDPVVLTGEPEKVAARLREAETRGALGAVLLFVGDALKRDSAELEKTEADIAKLEERLMTDRYKNGTAGEIVGYRRKLTAWKQRYEQLSDVFGELANRVAEQEVFAMRRRVERMRDSVLSLRDFLTEVRDAHQSSVQVRQNRLMQTFTVIAAIFMPLQLVTGWYGMNLAIPEFGVPWVYPVLACACAVLVIILLFVFKRKHWL